MTQHARIVSILVLAGLGIGCNASIDDATLAAAVPTVHQIQVSPNGSFFPDHVEIREGDEVLFTGPNGIAGTLPLQRTDSIVQVSRADIDAATLANEACMTSTHAYVIDHKLPNDDNELTGPLRRQASGMYALGPEENEGYYEGAATDGCDAIGAASGATVATAEEYWAEEMIVNGAKLCRKHTVADNKVSDTNSRYLLQSTWDNPDITGAVIRINWRDLYQVTVNGNVTTVTLDYSKLDTELENAARRGKLVFLEVLAGAGIPEWLFADYAGDVDASSTGIVAKSVIPVETSDYGSSSDTQMPTDAKCGYRKKMGSPADGAYKTALVDTLTAIAERVRGNSIHFQALGSLKVTGLNFLTGEMRLPRRCLDPAAINSNGSSQTRCWCNTAIWAAPLGTPVSVPTYPFTVNGGGYTYDIAQNFMRSVENAIYLALGRRKTMHYMLIQDGFPDVVDATHYGTDAPLVAPNLGYVDAAGAPINFSQQVKDALDSGQAGEFSSVDSEGVPLANIDLDAGALFSPMHASLGPKPASCLQPLTTAVVNGKTQGVVAEPYVMSTNLNDYSDAGSGCPNKWAVREGYEGQVIGFQTKNDIDTTDALSSLLWNATLYSNAVFIEVYEKTLWRAEQERLGGNAVLSTSVDGYASVPRRQKSLAMWTDELHARRRTIAGFPTSAGNRHLKDPFPDSHTVKFKKDLATSETYYFVNPAARCLDGALSYGSIEVVPASP